MHDRALHGRSLPEDPLPVTLTAVLRPGGALPAYFTGLLPEGHRLGALLVAGAELLLAVGTDTIGRVQNKAVPP